MAKPNVDQPTLAEASGLKTRPAAPGPSISASSSSAPARVLTPQDVLEAAKTRTKVTGTFRLTERHYRAGRMYEAGDLVSIVDEVPGKSWLPFDPTAPAAPPAAAKLSDSGDSLAEQNI